MIDTPPHPRTPALSLRNETEDVFRLSVSCRSRFHIDMLDLDLTSKRGSNPADNPCYIFGPVT